MSKFLFEKIIPIIHPIKFIIILIKSLTALKKKIKNKKFGIIPEKIKNLPNNVRFKNVRSWFDSLIIRVS
jgi:hypothetical protein